MAGLSDWLEDYRNWRGRSEWEQGKAIQDIYGGDPTGQERFERFGGFGTGSHGVGGLTGMIKASHGSPHLFDKFDFSKIGTGEGAQAYGHGGYFAQGFDSPVAKQYREALSGGAKKAVNASFSDDPELWVAGQLHSGIKPSEITEGLGILGYKGNSADLIKSAESRLKDELSSGHLYNVELKWPDAAREAADPLGEHHLLDWDAPLSEQPEGIRSIAGKAFGPKASELTGKELYEKASSYNPMHNVASKVGNDIKMMRQIFPNASNEELKQAIAESKNFGSNQKIASQIFRDLGIPGIRYLDAGSRFAGNGSRNYVMFDDQFPNIVSRNGVSLSDLLRR